MALEDECTKKNKKISLASVFRSTTNAVQLSQVKGPGWSNLSALWKWARKYDACSMVLQKYSYGLGIELWVAEERFPNGGVILGLGITGWGTHEAVGALCFCCLVNLVQTEQTEVQWTAFAPWKDHGLYCLTSDRFLETLQSGRSCSKTKRCKMETTYSSYDVEN